MVEWGSVWPSAYRQPRTIAAVPAAQANPIIRGEKVWLRPLEREDLEPSLRAINDREINDLAGFPGPIGTAM